VSNVLATQIGGSESLHAVPQSWPLLQFSSNSQNPTHAPVESIQPGQR
jgi:hypothetical protein